MSTQNEPIAQPSAALPPNDFESAFSAWLKERCAAIATAIPHLTEIRVEITSGGWNHFTVSGREYGEFRCAWGDTFDAAVENLKSQTRPVAEIVANKRAQAEALAKEIGELEGKL